MGWEINKTWKNKSERRRRKREKVDETKMRKTKRKTKPWVKKGKKKESLGENNGGKGRLRPWKYARIKVKRIRKWEKWRRRIWGKAWLKEMVERKKY